jgi:UDP-N-acetylmuramoyl-L-alanyl-D-glutamate--2,6-diaminopimelate ligase
MAVLQDILYKVSIRSLKGSLQMQVKDLQIDSRKVTAGSAFIAVKGSSSDGHEFIDAAIGKKASAIICDVIPNDIKDNVTYVQVENSSAAAGYMAHNFYDQPSAKLKLIGVTGTNGKTTTK